MCLVQPACKSGRGYDFTFVPHQAYCLEGSLEYSTLLDQPLQSSISFKLRWDQNCDPPLFKIRGLYYWIRDHRPSLDDYVWYQVGWGLGCQTSFWVNQNLAWSMHALFLLGFYVDSKNQNFLQYYYVALNGYGNKSNGVYPYHSMIRILNVEYVQYLNRIPESQPVDVFFLYQKLLQRLIFPVASHFSRLWCSYKIRWWYLHLFLFFYS